MPFCWFCRAAAKITLRVSGKVKIGTNYMTINFPSRPDYLFGILSRANIDCQL